MGATKIQTRTRYYNELRRINTFEERFEYLKLDGSVGVATFGYDRYLNQDFYRSREWLGIREKVITRDLGCDMGLAGYEINGRIIVHHLNPITSDNIKHGDRSIMDLNFLVCVSERTHRAIHYGDKNQLEKLPITRRPGDTKLW